LWSDQLFNGPLSDMPGGMNDSDLEPSGDRVRRSVRFDPTGWLMLCRIADAYWDGKRHPACDAAVLDAILGTTTAFPAEPDPAFNATVSELVAATAKRLSQPTKKFNFGAEVAAAITRAAESYPALPNPAAPPSLGFVRKLPTGMPPVPTGPWVVTVPKHFAHLLPESDLRAFLETALLQKAERLHLDGHPRKTLPAPRALPPTQSVLTLRYLDEAMVSILAALPLTAPIRDERLPIALQWLSSALQFRA
jgi:hypothetical protein